jgi:hypothetical protein
MDDTHDYDRREEEAWAEQGVKRNEGGREVERHCALKPRTRANDGNGQYSRWVRGGTRGWGMARAIAPPHGMEKRSLRADPSGEVR